MLVEVVVGRTAKRVLFKPRYFVEVVLSAAAAKNSNSSFEAPEEVSARIYVRPSTERTPPSDVQALPLYPSNAILSLLKRIAPVVDGDY